MSQQHLEAIALKLVANGQIIAAGFLSVRVLYPHVSDEEKDRLQHAYFAGAQQLYARITGFMELDPVPTVEDLKTLQAIDKELRAWSLKLRLPPIRARAAR